MFQLDLKSRKSIYEQVVDHIKELVLAGVLKPEERIPSVRELSRTITVNPNTVQKAYRELERQGYLFTVSGLGTFIAVAPEQKPDRQQIARVTAALRLNLRELRFLGLSEDRIRRTVIDLLSERGDQNDRDS